MECENINLRCSLFNWIILGLCIIRIDKMMYMSVLRNCSLKKRISESKLRWFGLVVKINGSPVGYEDVQKRVLGIDRT